jgi:transcriptional regulator with XRE-family HTH domain
MADITLRDIGRATGMSYSEVSRIERAVLPNVSVSQLARIGAVVGLDVRIRAYPGPDPLRDAGQLAVFERLRPRLAPALALRTEVGLPIEGDLRAWDGMITGFIDHGPALPVEIETRMHDAQAQQRRIALKARDGGAEAVLLVVGDTPRNREAIRSAGAMFTEAYPVPARAVMRALADGRHPGGSGLVFL